MASVPPNRNTLHPKTSLPFDKKIEPFDIRVEA